MRLMPVAAITAVLSVIAVPVASASPDEIAAALNGRPLDGAGNNVAHPDWGRANRTYLRLAPAVYGDGIGSMVAAPPARYVSNRIFNDVAQNVFSENGVTQWGFVWGQFLDHTFGLRQETGGEYRPIPFDRTDPLESYVNDFGAIDFSRTPAAPGTGVAGSRREQINTVSSYIDASSVYSDDNARLAWLRDGARLKLDADGNLPRRGTDPTAPVMALQGRLTGQGAKAMVAGDVRANENLALTATHTLFAREHNRIVDTLPATLPEELRFQIARRVVSAEQQHITYTEFLPALGIRLNPYRGYDPTVDATLGNEFATVGYRAHSMIHGEIEPEGHWSEAQLAAFEAQGVEVEREGDEAELAIPLNLTFANPDLLVSVGVDPVLAALGNEAEYRNDELIDDQLRSVLFQVPVPGAPSTCLDGSSLPTCFNGVVDLGAIDVERGRDHGMPSYNELRRAFGLAPRPSFAAITGETTDVLSTAADDPHMLDFTGLRNIHGADIDLGDTANAASAVRRTTLAARLKLVYGSVDKIDAFTGMLAESHMLGSDFGELQLAMWKRQFEALRDGDRFYYLNDPALALIERDYGLSARRTLGQVIRDNTDEAVRDDVFRLDGSPAFDHREGGVGATVAPTLSLTLGTPASFGAFQPGVARHYTASTTATVLSTAGDATLASSTPRLANGSFALAQPLQVGLSRSSWAAPTSNEAVTVTFTQPIGATEPLRTGAYAATVTLTLATTSP